MRTKASVIAVAGTVCAVALFAFMNTEAPSTSLFMQEHPLEKEFINFITEYRRSFGTQAEFKFRRDLFAKKFAELEKLKQEGINVVVNEFTDWSEDEKSKLFGYKPDENREMIYEDIDLIEP